MTRYQHHDIDSVNRIAARVRASRLTSGQQVHVSIPGSETYHTSPAEFDAFVVRADYASNGRCTGVVVTVNQTDMDNVNAHLYVSPARYVKAW